MPVIRPEPVIPGPAREGGDISVNALQRAVATTGRVEVNVIVAPRHMRLKTSIAATGWGVNPESGTVGDIVSLLPERERHDVISLGRVQERGIVHVNIAAGFGHIDGIIALLAGMAATIGGELGRGLEKPKVTMEDVLGRPGLGLSDVGPGVAQNVAGRGAVSGHYSDCVG